MTTITKMNNRLTLVEKDLGDFTVNSVVINGSRWNAVWDTLATPKDMKNIRSLISDKNTVVVYSHADWDHVWGTAALEGCFKLIMGHHSCRDRFMTELPDELAKFRKKNPEKWNEVRLLPPDVTFSECSVLDLGDLSFELHHVPGHSSDSIAGYIPEEGILLAGDTVETPFPSLTDQNSVDSWIDKLEELSALPELKTVIPSHGKAGGVEILQRNIEYLKKVKRGKNTEKMTGLNDFYRSVHKENLRTCGF